MYAANTDLTARIHAPVFRSRQNTQETERRHPLIPAKTAGSEADFLREMGNVTCKPEQMRRGANASEDRRQERRRTNKFPLTRICFNELTQTALLPGRGHPFWYVPHSPGSSGAQLFEPIHDVGAKYNTCPPTHGAIVHDEGAPRSPYPIGSRCALP